MNYNLFLDDVRDPPWVGNYIYPVELRKHYRLKQWIIVRSYDHFIRYIIKHGLPELISFDHDLVEGHYHKNMQEGILNYDSEDFDTNNYKTGYHCAKWLVEYCRENNLELPTCYIHSMNPVGTENIKAILKI
jgi:hypothetical protein